MNQRPHQDENQRGTDAGGRRAARAFTLIELLVVISIITLLIALLLPALGRAKLAANRVICLAEERQISLATMGYNNDFKETFPPYADPTGYSYVEPLPLLAPYTSGEMKVYICPASKDKPVVWGDWDPNAPYGGTFYADGSKAYSFNSHLRGSTGQSYWWNSGPPMKVSKIISPSKTFWVVDGTSQRFDFIYGWYFVSGYRHGGVVNTADWVLKPGAEGFNAGMADGHGEWVPWSKWMDWYNASAPAGSPFAWQ